MVTGHWVAALAHAVAVDGARVAAFVIPDRRQLGGEAWNTALAQLPAVERSRADRDLPQDAMMTLLDENGLPSLDLLPVFRAAPEQVFFPADGHLNKAGHAVTAEALAGWMNAARLVPNRSRLTGSIAPDENGPFVVPVTFPTARRDDRTGVP